MGESVRSATCGQCRGTRTLNIAVFHEFHDVRSVGPERGALEPVVGSECRKHGLISDARAVEEAVDVVLRRERVVSGGAMGLETAHLGEALQANLETRLHGHGAEGRERHACQHVFVVVTGTKVVRIRAGELREKAT